MAETIDHGPNDPFVRAAHAATAEGQTETVYAMRLEFKGKRRTEYWDVSATPISDDRFRDIRNLAYRMAKKDGHVVVGCDLVSRTVTITASDWAVSARESSETVERYGIDPAYTATLDDLSPAPEPPGACDDRV